MYCSDLFQKDFTMSAGKKGKLFEVLMRKATVIVVDAFDC